MAENNNVNTEQEELIKLVTLDILNYYDSKIKPWVVQRITSTEGIGSLTPEELSQMIRAEVDNSTALEII